MGITKTALFTETQNELATMAKAFAHPARIAILQHLFKTKDCVCGHLVNEIGLAQPTISQHLKELKHSGLIKGNIEGTSVCYCIDIENWNSMRHLLTNFLNHDTNQKEECC